jgi:ribonuclease P protein component
VPGPTGRFGARDRLLRASEFRTVGQEGRRAADACFVVLVRERDRGVPSGTVRVGITVSRKVGPAVVRNRVKRRVREWFRSARAWMRPGIDLVVIARRAAAERSAHELDGELGVLARAAGAGALV